MTGMHILDSGWGGHSVLILIVVMLGVDAFIYVPAVTAGLIVRRRGELRAGYTTLIGEFPDVDLVDPETGRVVRMAGEERLPQQKYEERLRLVREDRQRCSGNE
jgi:hypothetical protein